MASSLELKKTELAKGLIAFLMRYDASGRVREQARFGTLEEAVEAVDYEVGRRGRKVVASAYPSAEWRRRAAPAALRERLAELAPRRRVSGWGAALQLADSTLWSPLKEEMGKGDAGRRGTGSRTSSAGGRGGRPARR